jgi:hypothetical protein
MLTAKFLNAYTSKAGAKRARYTVSGSSTELEAYKTAQSTYLQYADDGTTPIIFGDVAMNLTKSYKIGHIAASNRYFVDFNEITAAAGSIENAEKRGNARLADAVATQLATELRGNTVTPSASNALQAAVAEAPEPVALDKPISPKVKGK